MQALELYFNPKRSQETNIIFDSFCYEPENVYERKLGNIYIVGELKNVLPQNLRLLEKISQVIKEKYYSNYLKSPEEALKGGLKALNDFLGKEVKKDNTDWMGNLGLAIISTTPQQKSWADLSFTKIGDLKILLLRENQVLDIGCQLKTQEIEPYPLKVFSNIVSGKIAENDIIAIFTKEVFEFFQAKNLIQKISQEKDLKDKRIKEILKPEEKELLKISGTCLLIKIKDEIKPKAILAFEQKFETIPFFRLFNKIKNSYHYLPKIALPKFKMPSFNKNLVLISLLIFILMAGFLVAKSEKEKENRQTKESLQEIESKISNAENLLLKNDKENANILYQEAFQGLSALIKRGGAFAKESISLKNSVEEKLNKLNNLEKIEEPKILFEIDSRKAGVVPYRMLFTSPNFYFYNPFSSSIYKFDASKGLGSLLEGKSKFQFGVGYLDSMLFFSKPNLIISLKDDKLQEKIFELPDFSDLAVYRSNIYFLNSKTGEIVSYSPALNKKEVWLKQEASKSAGANLIALDGSVWLLTQSNQIDRYYRGSFQESLKISLFPGLKSPTKIWTSASLPYLYILEPSQKRILILTKDGKIFKQYQSEKFDNLLDFTISQDGKIIYLLNDSKVYQLF